VKKPSLPLLLLASAILTGGLFVFFRALPPLTPCADATAQSLGLALCFGLGFSLLTGARLWRERRFRWALGIQAALLMLTVWLGFYPISPFFAGRRIPILQGFSITTRTRGTRDVAPGGVVTLSSGAPAAIRALTLVADTRCRWMSAQGGALDDPQSCATVYIPPQAERDILKVSLQPGCGLPRSVEQLKISILP
jgi:hypothetical protein